MLSRTLACVFLLLIFPCGWSAEQLVISEFQAINKRTLLTPDGKTDDWIEIQNLATDPIDLQGWYLSDDRDSLRKWSFPKAVIDPGGFLVVMASGQNRRLAGAEYHTNFKLSSAGEFLALVKPDGMTIVDSYSGYPQQAVDVSYGLGSDGRPGFFAAPSPGRANSESFSGILAGPHFSVARGFHAAPFRLELTSEMPNAVIRYTLDGSDPNRENGRRYQNAIAVETTTVVRARTFADGFLPSTTETHTYLFLPDIPRQGNRPAGYPEMWKGKEALFPADYEMDPEITGHPAYRNLLDEALLAVPTISLVTDIAHLFDREHGIYQNPKGSGREWERPVSVEWFLPDGRMGFQVNAGVRIQGNGSRTPKKSPKHSFRLVFRKIYGPDRLRFPIFEDGRATEEFDTLILRAEYNQSWIHRNDQRERAQFVRDQWMKDTQRAMGYPSPHATYAHLYLNGLYWGLYSPNERATADFAAAYQGGEAKAYDATNSGNLVDGSLDGYEQVFRLAERESETDEVNQQLRRVVDVDALIDYMILNQYAGNRDRDSHNWYSIHRRDGGGLQYICWDAESILVDALDNRLSLNEEFSPSGLFRRMMRDHRFARQFADHVQRHLFGAGVLTAERGQERWRLRASRVFEAVVAESARWGDYRRDVAPTPEYPAPLLERDVHWVKERDRVLNEVLPARTAIVLQHYREQGYYPEVDAPRFSQYGGTIPEAFDLRVSAPAGQLYYTLDGSDPMRDNGPSPNAIRGASSGTTIRLTSDTQVKARAFAAGIWSALTEGHFTRSGGLRVSELMFHSAGGRRTERVADDSFDFIELTNVAAHPLDLSGVRLTDAVEFAFMEGTQLAPGEVAVLVDDEAAFKRRYGLKNASVLGVYEGRLNNAGEELTIVGSMGERILQLAYKDSWYQSADGKGASLVFADLSADPDTWSLRASWRASPSTGGSPGVIDPPKTP